MTAKRLTKKTGSKFEIGEKEKLQMELNKANEELENIKIQCAIIEESKAESELSLKTEIKFLINKLMKTKGKLEAKDQINQQDEQRTRSISTNNMSEIPQTSRETYSTFTHNNKHKNNTRNSARKAMATNETNKKHLKKERTNKESSCSQPGIWVAQGVHEKYQGVHQKFFSQICKKSITYS